MKIISEGKIGKFVDSLEPNQSTVNRKIVQSIILDVKKNGDKALKKYEKKFGANVSSLIVSPKEIKEAYSKVSQSELQAINLSKNLLLKNETKLKNQLKKISTTDNGIKIIKNFLPLNSVGCYIPGGLAKYPSSAIMSIIPAKVAGVKRITVVSPPNSDGKLDPLTIVASDISGATEIFKTGGAQAISALAYGTRTILPVDKIVGPGGPFVSEAKFLVSNVTSIDMIAGPTELGIISDGTSNPEFIALDLISQAEHSTDSFCFLLTTSKSLANRVQQNVENNLKDAKRKKIIKTSLEKSGFLGICKNETEMVKLANKLAPEHIEIMTKNPDSLAQKITSAGLILLGNSTPSSASDYLLGSNHILPTSRFGRVRGSLSVLDFLKLNTQVKSSQKTLKKISNQLKTFTNAEGLPNHYEAVKGRIN